MIRVDPLAVRSAADYDCEDDDELVAAAIAAAVADGSGVVLLSGRTYELTEQLVLPDAPIALVGCGSAFTELRWDCEDGGILYEPTATTGRELVLRDLSLTTTQTSSAGAALEATWPESEGTYAHTLKVLGCEIRGVGFTQSWNIGLDITGGRNVHITRSQILGKSADYATLAAATLTDAIHIESEESSCVVWITDTNCRFCRIGVNVEETAATGPEGIRITGCQLIGCNQCVVAQTGEPYLCIRATDMKARYRAVVTSMVRGAISDCHIELKDEDVAGSGGIYLVGSAKHLRIHDTFFDGSPSCAVDCGIVLMGASPGVGVNNCTIHDCGFNDFNHGILFNTDSFENWSHHNVFESCTADTTDLGTDTIIE